MRLLNSNKLGNYLMYRMSTRRVFVKDWTSLAAGKDVTGTSSINDNSGFNSGSGSSAHSAVAQPIVAKRDHVADWLVAQPLLVAKT